MRLHDDVAELQGLLSWLVDQLDTLVDAADGMIACLEAGGTVLTCGNGGSAAQAQHLSTELLGRFRTDRRSLPSVCLASDASLLTCVANDFGWDHTFSRPLEGIGQSRDVLVALSTSGNSTNIVRALEAARHRDIRSLALLGGDGGTCRGLASWELLVPATSTARVQEVHLAALHHLCERIELAFDGS